MERISKLEEDFVLFCLLIRFRQHRPRHTGSLECQPWHIIYRASTNMDKGEVKINNYPELPDESISPEGTGIYNLEGKKK